MCMMISEQSGHFFQRLNVATVHLLLSSHIDSKTCTCVTTWHFTKMDNQMAELAKKDEGAAKKWKVLNGRCEIRIKCKSLQSSWPEQHWNCLHSRDPRYARSTLSGGANLLILMRKAVVTKGQRCLKEVTGWHKTSH